MLFGLLVIVFNNLILMSGDDEKKKRQERLKKNRNSSVSSKTRESIEGSDQETSETVSQPNNNAGIALAPIVILPETSGTTVTSVHSSEAAVPLSVMSNCELNSETTNLLSMSKLVHLGKDGLSSSLPSDLMSVIESSLGASLATTLTPDSPDLMRTLTTDEERVIQELVQVGICSKPENAARQFQITCILYQLGFGNLNHNNNIC